MHETMGYIDITVNEAETISPEIAILPIGSFEQHGSHLPLGTDDYEVEAIAEETAKRLGAFLLPVQSISVCYEHHGKRGSVHYTAPVFFRFLEAMACELHRQGFSKVVFLCGHGGVFVLGPAVRHLNSRHPDLRVIAVSAYGGLHGPDSPLKDSGGIHADEMETSLMLYLHPELVDMDKAVDYLPETPQRYLNYGAIFTHSPSGVWGRATRATAEKGKWILAQSVNHCVETITQTFAAMGSTDYYGRPAIKETAQCMEKS